MTRLKRSVLTLALAGFLAGQAVVPALAVTADAVEEPAENMENVEGTELVEKEEPVEEAAPIENVESGTPAEAPSEDVVENTAVAEPSAETPAEITVETPAAEETIEITPAEEAVADRPAAETAENNASAAESVAEASTTESGLIATTSLFADDEVQVMVASEDRGEQAVIALPDGYTETDAMTRIEKGAQKNGRDSGSSASGQLVKTAEWTDYDAGEAEINLTYAVPQQEPSRAVYVMGSCYVHGFLKDVAIQQIMEIVNKYEYVDVLMTDENLRQLWYSGYVGPFVDMETGALKEDYVRMIHLAFTPQNKTSARSILESTITTNYAGSQSDSAAGWHVLNRSSHTTGVLALTYLTEYFKKYNPTSVYVSFDGSRAFQDTELDAAPAGDSATAILYGTSVSGLNSKSDLGGVDAYRSEFRSTIQRLAEYQKNGNYYVCISTETYGNQGPFNRAHYTSELASKYLCYMSFSLVNPYYFVNNHDALLGYLSGSEGSARYDDSSVFSQIGNPLISYGKSFADNGIELIETSATFTDTVADGLTFNPADIEVTVDGKAVDAGYVLQTVDGNKITITVREVQTGQTVRVRIPVRIAGDGKEFSQAGTFAATNAGKATAESADGKTVTVDSPKLYKGAFRITTEVVHGTITDSIQDILPGENREITYQPQEGYALESVTVDGEPVDAKAWPEQYEFRNITASHTIKVVYAQLRYQITTAVEHGKITDPVSKIPWGSDQKITYEPEEGYQLDSITVDGKQVEVKDYPKEYDFTKVTADHAIKVVYTKIEEPKKETLTTTDETTHHKTTKYETTNHETRNEKTTNTTTENVQVVNKTVVNEVTGTAAGTVTEPVAEPVIEETGEVGAGIATTGDGSLMRTYAGIALLAAAVLAAYSMRRRLGH